MSNDQTTRPVTFEAHHINGPDHVGRWYVVGPLTNGPAYCSSWQEAEDAMRRLDLLYLRRKNSVLEQIQVIEDAENA